MILDDLEDDWSALRMGTREKDETYVGYRDENGVAHVYVELNGKRRDLPGPIDFEFDWGVHSQGAAFLAHGILEDALGERIARQYSSVLRQAVFDKMPDKGWSLTRRELESTLRELFVPF
jgi:hypothetical protein